MKDPLPTYAIVELSTRATLTGREIGRYVDHTVYDTGIVVKTNKGIFKFSKYLVYLQHLEPEKITDAILARVAESFSPF